MYTTNEADAVTYKGRRVCWVAIVLTLLAMWIMFVEHKDTAAMLLIIFAYTCEINWRLKWIEARISGQPEET